MRRPSVGPALLLPLLWVGSATAAPLSTRARPSRLSLPVTWLAHLRQPHVAAVGPGSELDTGGGWSLSFAQDARVIVDAPHEDHPQTHAARGAAFGPRIPSDIPGVLIPISHFLPSNSSAQPDLGCPAPSSRSHHADHRPVEKWNAADGGANLGWVALAERGGCSFADKVLAAQALGAIAVVVGDEPGTRGGLLTMWSPGDTSAVRIPSVFVTRTSYLQLLDAFTLLPLDSAGLPITIAHEQVFVWPLADLLLLLLLLPSILTFSTLILHHIRAYRRRRADRAPEEVVEGLVAAVWGEEGVVEKEGRVRGEGEHEPLLQGSRRKVKYWSSECAICLCDFLPGDKVRILPCGHLFHRPEIDDWLLHHKKTCPICKLDVTLHPLPKPSDPLPTPAEPAAPSPTPSNAEASTSTSVSPAMSASAATADNRPSCLTVPASPSSTALATPTLTATAVPLPTPQTQSQQQTTPRTPRSQSLPPGGFLSSLRTSLH